MEAEKAYIEYLKALGEYQHRGYTIPKDWDKIKKHANWKFIKAFADKIDSSMSLVNVGDFMKANFIANEGKFYPHQFLHRQSIINYTRWRQQMSREDDDLTKVRKSVINLALFIKESGKSITSIFNPSNQVYPDYVRLYVQQKLHPWILAFYIKKYDEYLLNSTPSDIIEHAFNTTDLKKIEEILDIHWLKLINNTRAYKII